MADIANKNVLVTGGAGFIGSHLCDGLLEKGAAKVVCVDNFFLGKMENLSDALSHDNFTLYHDDARNFGVMQAIIEKENIEVVFNLGPSVKSCVSEIRQSQVWSSENRVE
jgi:UDP-glucose 4-epimerase